MKKYTFYFFRFLMSIFTMHSQNIQQLEAKPSFKRDNYRNANI